MPKGKNVKKTEEVKGVEKAATAGKKAAAAAKKAVAAAKKAAAAAKKAEKPEMTVISVYELLSERFEALEDRISQIEKNLSLKIKSINNVNYTETEISDEEFLKIVREAYHKIDDKLGDMVTIPALTTKIKEKLGWDIQLIHEKLYDLYLNHKIDLQPGKIKEGTPMKIEGNVFYWFKFR